MKCHLFVSVDEGWAFKSSFHSFFVLNLTRNLTCSLDKIFFYGDAKARTHEI